jgi:hypothetical protein
VSEYISYIVTESGTGELPDGTKIEAGVVVTDSTRVYGDPFGGEQIYFDQPFTSPPAIFHSLNTYNNDDYMTTMVHSVTVSGFMTQQQNQYPAVTSTTETISWIAVGTLNGLLYEVGRGNDGTDDGKAEQHKITYTNNYELTTPIVVAKGNSAWSTSSWEKGFCSRGSGDHGVKWHKVVAIEAGLNTTTHVDELFGWFVIECPTYYPSLPEGDVYDFSNIWTTNNYIFQPTLSGVNVYNSTASVILSDIYCGGGVSSVWADTTYLYIGTMASGIYRCTLSGIESDPQAVLYTAYPNITNNVVKSLAGAGNYLCAVTASGVDHIHLDTSNRYYASVEGGHKCYQTSNGEFYYIKQTKYFDDSNLNDKINNWDYFRTITFSEPIPDWDYVVEITLEGIESEYYRKINVNGDDLRFIDPYGNLLDYFIDYWEDTANVLIKIKEKNTEVIYMLYGNQNALPLSDYTNVYIVYEEFNGQYEDVPPNWLNHKWSGHSLISDDNFKVQDGYLKLCNDEGDRRGINYDNGFISYGKLELEIRHDDSGGITRFDFQTNFYIGEIHYDEVSLGVGIQNNPTTEYPHRIITASGSTVGTEIVSTMWKKEEWYHGVDTTMSGVIKSTFYNETLEATGDFNLPCSTILIGNENYSSDTTCDISYIKFSKQSLFYTPTITVSSELNVDDYFYSSLNAVYDNNQNWTESTVGYVYNLDYVGFQNQYVFNDIHVTENTSEYSNDNVIFLATDTGAVIIEERKSDEGNSRVKRYYLK